MNERIKKLRKHLKLSGEKFGSSLGLTRMGISKIETGQYLPTEQTIKSICREFNVNEDWLRFGNGDMFISTDQISLDDLLRQNSVDKLEDAIIRSYLTLDKETRKNLLSHFINSLKD